MEGDWYVLGLSSARTEAHSREPCSLYGSSGHLVQCHAGGVVAVGAWGQEGKQRACLTREFEDSSGQGWTGKNGSRTSLLKFFSPL